MASGYFHIVVNPKPDNYTLPVFPSLYWPFPVDGRQTHYLYDAKPIWRFTLLWTLISVIGIHVVAASYAVMTHWREWRFIWIVPIVFGVIGGIEALIAGNAVGGLLAAVYTSGHFRMSTWIPLSWGLINAMTLILSSFAIQGGL